MKKIGAIILIILGSCFVIYSLIVLVNCFTLLSFEKFDSQGIGYSIGTLFWPLLLLVIARWVIKKGVKIYKNETIKKNII